MKHTLLLFLAASQLLTSCGSKESRMQDFVNKYNASAAMISVSNEGIKSTTAKIKGQNKIELVFNYNIPFDVSDKTSYAQIAPGLMVSLIDEQRDMQKLLNDGVVFEVIMTASDNQILFQTELDKAKVKAIKDKQNNNSKPGSTTSGGNSEMQSIINTLNKNLPIVDKEAGTTITKIDINENNEIVYTVLVNKALADVLKLDANKDVMKDEIMRNNGLKIVFRSMAEYGVTAMRYQYLDETGKIIADILINSKDLQ